MNAAVFFSGNDLREVVADRIDRIAFAKHLLGAKGDADFAPLAAPGNEENLTPCNPHRPQI